MSMMALAGLSVAGGALQTGASFWCTHALQNVFRDTPAPAVAAGRLTASGAKGQTVAAQIVIRSGAAALKLQLPAPSALQRSEGREMIPPSAITAAFVETYHVAKNSTATPEGELLRKAPADFPDPLSEAAEVVVPPQTTQPILVRFRIPRGAAPGEYQGILQVPTDGTTLQVPVTVTVYGFELPTATRLLVTIWTNTDSLAKHQKVAPDSAAYWSLLERVAAMMQQHHQNVILTSWSLVGAVRAPDGKVRFDFSRFDRWVETFLGKGFRRIEIGHVGGREHGQWEDPKFVSYTLACHNEKSGATDQLQIEEWLPALERHLRDRGWLTMAMIHVADEPIPVNLASWKELSARVRAAAPGLKRIDAVHVPDLEGQLETWVPQLNYLEQWLPRFREAQTRGTELWYYTAWVPQGRYPNRLMDYALIKTRMLHWLNYTSGTTGYLHWGWNYWDVPFDQFAPGDNNIVWPGASAPRGSLRYEAMREGIEDYEYLRLLEDAVERMARRGRVSGADSRRFVLGFANMLAPSFQDFSRDPEALYAVRDQIARAIVSLNGRVPFAVRAVRRQGELEIEGLAPPGAAVRCADAHTSADGAGRFSLAPNSGGLLVTLTVTVDGAEHEFSTTVVSGR